MSAKHDLKEELAVCLAAKSLKCSFQKFEKRPGVLLNDWSRFLKAVEALEAKEKAARQD